MQNCDTDIFINLQKSWEKTGQFWKMKRLITLVFFAWISINAGFTCDENLFRDLQAVNTKIVEALRRTKFYNWKTQFTIDVSPVILVDRDSKVKYFLFNYYTIVMVQIIYKKLSL